MLEALLQSLSIYYGMDWAALTFGLFGNYLITQKNAWGFVLCALGCTAGFAVAMISSQFGFIAYNIILLCIFTRGYINWNVDERLERAKSVEFEAAE